MIPFFNAKMYAEVKRISSTSEIIGTLKEAEWIDGLFIFRLAGTLGFYYGPPEKKKFYQNFKWLDAHLDSFDSFLNEQLATFQVLDLTVTSVDSSNIPMDKRDTTSSQGTGSRGSFFGHKSSIGADSKCIPITQELETGRVHDTILFPDTLDTIQKLSMISGQDMWVVEADAGYFSGLVIDQITHIEAVLFVDLNPKNSSLLKKY